MSVGYKFVNIELQYRLYINDTHNTPGKAGWIWCCFFLNLLLEYGRDDNIYLTISLDTDSLQLSLHLSDILV
jgi:hypothetical protein